MSPVDFFVCCEILACGFARDSFKMPRAKMRSHNEFRVPFLFIRAIRVIRGQLLRTCIGVDFWPPVDPRFYQENRGTSIVQDDCFQTGS